MLLANGGLGNYVTVTYIRKALADGHDLGWRGAGACCNVSGREKYQISVHLALPRLDFQSCQQFQIAKCPEKERMHVRACGCAKLGPFSSLLKKVVLGERECMLLYVI